MNSSMSLYQSAVLTPSTSTSPNTTHVKYTSAEPFTPQFVKDHLTKLTKSAKKLPSSRAQALYDERVRRRQLGLARRGNPSSAKKGKEKKEKGAVKGEKMGRREAAAKGMWRLREEEAKWDAFVPLHRLWLGYMSELLGLVTEVHAQARAQAQARGKGLEQGQTAPAMKTAMPMAAGMHAKLVKADFHGSIMTVRRSKNAALVGASGIVVQETENTFKVVTRKDKSKVLPKQGSVFAFAVPLYSTEPSSSASASATTAAAAGSGTNSGTNGDGEGGDCEDDTREARTVLDGPHIEFELYGNQFCFRAADRAGRKFKHKETIEL